MAIHTTLPIYKTTYDLLVLAAGMTKNMPRDFKVSMGGKITEECVEAVLLIFRANCAKQKTQYLDELLETVQTLELLMRLSKDLRLISTGQYAQAIALTDQIGKQANGWRKHSASSPVA